MKLLWDCIYFTLLIRLGSGKGLGPPGQGSSGGLGVCTLGYKERFVSTLKARAKQSPRGGNRDEEAGCSPLTAPSLTPSLPPARPSLHCVLRRRGQSPWRLWRAHSALITAAFPVTEFQFNGKKEAGAQGRSLWSLRLAHPGASPAREAPGP